jgi:hypothetical protein
VSLAARLRKHTRPIARLGCIAIGTVYVLVGSVALLALAGIFTDHADEYRLVRVVMEWPGGTLIIWTIIAGLMGYVIWRVVEVFADPYEFGSDLRGLATRVGIGLSGLAYGIVAFSAARIALGAPGTNETSEQEQQRLVAEILSWPGGAWWVGIAGGVLWIFAVLQIVLIIRRSYTLEINMDDRSPAMRRVIHGLAAAGYAARGVILAVLGYFLVKAATTFNPGEVGDTDTAFDFIGGGVVGDSAFFVVAVATVGYGLFMYLCAAFYQFQKVADSRRRT